MNTTTTTPTATTKPTYGFILSTDSITVTLRGKTVTVRKEHLNYTDLVMAISRSASDDEIASLMTPTASITTWAALSGAKVSLENGVLTINGRVFDEPVLVDRLTYALTNKLPADALVNFAANIALNPSASARKDAFRYIEAHNLPLTMDGCFLGYKGVCADFWSRHGNTSIVPLRGHVDEQGRLFNAPGQILTLDRGDVDDKSGNHCSTGLHVGSRVYATDWAAGGKVVIVKVNPRDVVTIPTDSVAKLRCCEYEVVAECEADLPDKFAKVSRSTISCMAGDFVAENQAADDLRAAYVKPALDPDEVRAAVERIAVTDPDALAEFLGQYEEEDEDDDDDS